MDVDGIKENYNTFNKLYGDNSLPEVSFSVRSMDAQGETFFNWKDGSIEITLTDKYELPERFAKETLLHEMIHVADSLRGKKSHRYDGHGEFFQKEAERISKFGGIIGYA